MTPRKRTQRGNTIIEFAAVSIVIIPLFFGMVATGVNMSRMVQAVQVSRDLGHMYAKGINFSQTTNQNIAIALASGTGITASGGNGAMILSQIVYVYQADCTAAGLASGCTNLGKYVFVNRIVIGNSNTTGRYGTPASSIVNSSGNIAAADYLTNTTAVANGVAALTSAAGLTMADGDILYLSEFSLSTPEISFIPNATSQGVYASAIF